MRRLLIGGMAFAMVFLVTGCGDSHDSVMKDTVGVINEMATVMEGIKDEESAKAAKPKLEKLGEKMKDLKKRADKLGDPSKEKEEALKKKYEPELKKAMTRLVGAAMKAATVPGGAEALKSLESLKNLGGGSGGGGLGGK